jgi:uncharacterized membrane protein
VFGLSLGSFGGETAFSGEYDLRNRTAGALFAGPPNFNTLYREFTDHRDAGTHEVEPTYKDGRTVRFTNDVVAEIPPASVPWEGTRVLYLQHPSDPIVWWGPSLIWDQPDWLGEPRGRDVLDQMFWIPLVTFWQVTADLPWPLVSPTATATPTRPSSSTAGRRSSSRPAGPTPRPSSSGTSSRRASDPGQSGTLTSSRPFSAAGNLGPMASRVSAMVRATTRLRYHFLLAGTTYQGAYAVEHSLTASSKAAW